MIPESNTFTQMSGLVRSILSFLFFAAILVFGYIKSDIMLVACGSILAGYQMGILKHYSIARDRKS
jgi:hypothetical protein